MNQFIVPLKQNLSFMCNHYIGSSCIQNRRYFCMFKKFNPFSMSFNGIFDRKTIARSGPGKS